MDMELLLQQIFEVCIIPLLGVLTKFAVEYLAAKRDEAGLIRIVLQPANILICYIQLLRIVQQQQIRHM